MNRVVTFTQLVAFGAIVVAGIAARGQLPDRPPSLGDWIFIGLFFALMAWCVQVRVPHVDAEGHEQTSQGLAFRLGKALNRVRRRLRG